MGCCCICDCVGNCIGGIVRTVFRWGLLVANVLFFLAGLGILAVGIIININLNEWSAFYSEDAMMPSILLIAAGCVTTLAACFGIVGTCKRKGWALFTYTGLVVVACLLLLSGGGTTFSSRPEYEENLRTRMLDLMPLYSNTPGTPEQTEATDAWNKMQTETKCCGVDLPTDWSTYNPGLVGSPDSCNCEAGEEGCGANEVFAEGCYTKLVPHSIDMIVALGGAAFTVAGFELVAAVLSFCLASVYCGSKKGSRKSSDSS